MLAALQTGELPVGKYRFLSMDEPTVISVNQGLAFLHVAFDVFREIFSPSWPVSGGKAMPADDFVDLVVAISPTAQFAKHMQGF